MVDRFDHVAVTNDQNEKMVDVAQRAELLEQTIENHAPDGREKSLAITKLEEAVMWANKAISRG